VPVEEPLLPVSVPKVELVPRVLVPVLEPVLRVVVLEEVPVEVPRVTVPLVVPVLVPRVVVPVDVPREGVPEAVPVEVPREEVPVEVPVEVPRVVVPVAVPVPRVVLLPRPAVVLVLALRPVEVALGAAVVLRAPVMRSVDVTVFSPRELVMRVPAELAGLYLTGLSERGVVMLPTSGSSV